MFFSTCDHISGFDISRTFGAVSAFYRFPLTNGQEKTDGTPSFSQAWKDAEKQLDENARHAFGEKVDAIVGLETNLAVVPNFSYMLVILTGTAVSIFPDEAESNPIVQADDLQAELSSNETAKENNRPLSIGVPDKTKNKTSKHRKGKNRKKGHQKNRK